MSSNSIRKSSPFEGMTGAEAARSVAGRIAPETLTTIEDLEFLVVHVVLSPAFRDKAKDKLVPSLFVHEGEAGLAAVVEVVMALSAKYPGKIPYGTLRSQVVRRIDDDPLIDEVTWSELMSTGEDGEEAGLLHRCYRQQSLAELDVDYASDLLREFLRERMIGEKVRQFASASKFGLPADMSQFINEIQDAEAKIAAGEDSPFGSVKFDGRIESLPARNYLPTGCSFVDKPLGGGVLEQDVSGLVGMVHAGKSTLVAQFAANTALALYARHLASPKQRPRRAVIFSYEDPLPRVQARIWAHAADVHKDSLKAMDLSRSGGLKPYELEAARRTNVDPRQYPGEYERLMSVTAKLDMTMTVVDMTRDGRGSGGVAEVASILARGIREHGWDPGFVLIDYANVLVKNKLEADGKNPNDHLRHGVAALTNQIRRQVAMTYNTPVWIMQQFATKDTVKRWDAPLHPSQAAECSAFFENLDNCFTLGNHDKRAKVAYIECHKAKDTDGATSPRVMVQLHGDFSRFVDVDGTFVVENGQPVAAETVAQIRGDFVAPARTRRRAMDAGGNFGPLPWGR